MNEEKQLHDLWSEKRAKTLQAKYQDKSFYEEWYILATIGKLSKFILQILSALTAVTLVAYAFMRLTGSWTIGIVVGCVIMFILEVVKYVSTGKLFKSYFKTSKLKKGVLVLAAGISVGSILCSSFGTPIFISEVTPRQSLDLSPIQDSFQKKEKEVTLFWTETQEKADKEAKDFFDKNSWKGKIHYKRQGTYQAYKDQSAAAMDSLTSALVTLRSKATETTEGEMGKHSEISKAEEEELATIGFIFMFVTLGFELLYFVISYALEMYDYLDWRLRNPNKVEQAQMEQPKIVESPTSKGSDRVIIRAFTNSESNEAKVKRDQMVKMAKELRKQKLTYREIGGRLGVSHTQVSRLVKS